MTGDIDVWATGATFSPLNNNGKFSLNLVAYMVQNSGNYSAPVGSISSTPAPRGCRKRPRQNRSGHVGRRDNRSVRRN